jgi:hypothetical protein
MQEAGTYIDVLKPGAGPGYIPVEEIVDVNIVSLVKAFADPQCGPRK